MRHLALGIVALLAPGPALAHDDAAWKAEREARFASVKASLPRQETTTADIKAKTAALVASSALATRALDTPPIIWRTSTKPVVLFDKAVAPRMVVVPAGEFTIGSPASERGRQPSEAQRRVQVARPFAVSMFPVTYGEYAWFVHATGHPSASTCRSPGSGAPVAGPARDWREPGFAQTPRSPATCIGYRDAVAYARWVSRETGQRYRLLSDAEYEYAARAGTTTAYWWGDEFATGCKQVNAADPCDANAFANPLDQSKANSFGLFEMAGNVASWTSDCRHGRCAVRGGSWATPATGLRSSARSLVNSDEVSADRGFRIARDL